MEEIREHIVALSGPKAPETLVQTPEEMERALRGALGNLR